MNISVVSEITGNVPVKVPADPWQSFVSCVTNNDGRARRGLRKLEETSFIENNPALDRFFETARKTQERVLEIVQNGSLSSYSGETTQPLITTTSALSLGFAQIKSKALASKARHANGQILAEVAFPPPEVPGTKDVLDQLAPSLLQLDLEIADQVVQSCADLAAGFRTCCTTFRVATVNDPRGLDLKHVDAGIHAAGLWQERFTKHAGAQFYLFADTGEHIGLSSDPDSETLDIAQVCSYLIFLGAGRSVDKNRSSLKSNKELSIYLLPP